MPRIKKEDEFYTMLKEFAALITESAEEYNSIICDFPKSMSSIPQMKVYESTADERVKAIMAKLYTSFITPIDREDISNLALAMDDVVDSMYGVAVRLDLFNIGDLRIEAKQISELTLHAVHEMQEMIDHLPDYKKDRVVLEKAIEIGTVEDEGLPEGAASPLLRRGGRERQVRGHLAAHLRPHGALSRRVRPRLRYRARHYHEGRVGEKNAHRVGAAPPAPPVPHRSALRGTSV